MENNAVLQTFQKFQTSLQAQGRDQALLTEKQAKI